MIEGIQKILLLGGSGYLGSHIATRFKKEVDFDLTIGDLIKPINSAYDFIKVDVLNNSFVSSLIRDYDLIINCAGQITNPITISYRINTKGIDSIIHAVKTHNKKLYHVSTVAVYGTAEYADEKSELSPESSYAACKAFAEYQINNHLSKERFCILRIPNLYGENQPKGLLAYILKSSLSDTKLQFNNDGSLSRYFLHVDDCSDAIFSAVQKNLEGTFNIPSNEKYNLKEIISFIETVCNIKFEKRFDRREPIDNIDELNFSSFESITGFKPRRTLNDFINGVFPKHA